MRKYFIWQIVILIFLAFTYIMNFVKLVNCDFDPKGSWKGEIVYVIGAMGAAPITAWFDLK